MGPWYRKYGKIQEPITDADFVEGMRKGHFCGERHKGFVALLYYSAVRKSEALRALREQFRLSGDDVIFEVGKRLKHGIQTPPLNIPLEAPYVDEIWKAVLHTQEHSRVFPYSPRTGYNIVNRVFLYPHFFRLSRITNFFAEGWTIAQVHSWTGLTLKALDYYVGLVSVKQMGKSLVKKNGITE